MTAAGWHYVVKPPSIGSQAIVGEWLGARLLAMLGIMAADVLPIAVPTELAAQCWPEQSWPDPVLAVASAYPADPDRVAIYDFLPPAIQLANPEHLIGTLAVDLWTGRSEPRQHVFFRQGPMWACAIDHKSAFGHMTEGSGASPAPINPAMHWAYSALSHDQQIERWTAALLALRPDSLRQLVHSLPECWAQQLTPADADALTDRLLARRSLLPGLLARVLHPYFTSRSTQCDSMSVSLPCPI